MLTVLVTGGIGSGKSAVCSILQKRGVPVYDCDSRVKQMYVRRPSLIRKLEDVFGKFDRKKLSRIIFEDPSARERLESIVYPVLLADLRRWKTLHRGCPLVAVESAIMLSKPIFDGVADIAVLVDAPQALRIERVMKRSGLSRKEVIGRMQAQDIPMGKVHFTLINDGSAEDLSNAVNAVFFDKNGYICRILKETEIQ